MFDIHHSLLILKKLLPFSYLFFLKLFLSPVFVELLRCGLHTSAPRSSSHSVPLCSARMRREGIGKEKKPVSFLLSRLHTHTHTHTDTHTHTYTQVIHHKDLQIAEPPTPPLPLLSSPRPLPPRTSPPRTLPELTLILEIPLSLP